MYVYTVRMEDTEDMEDRAIQVSSLHMICPVCNENIPIEDFIIHSYINHTQFFLVWATYYAPNLLRDMFPEYQDDEDLSYEYLLNLCDSIGYHKVGIRDVDAVAPIVITDRNKQDTCTICLEEMSANTLKRKTKTCKHTFCAACLETWLQENKTCPLCVRHLEEEQDQDQIASISNSSSDPELPSAPSAPSAPSVEEESSESPSLS